MVKRANTRVTKPVSQRSLLAEGSLLAGPASSQNALPTWRSEFSELKKEVYQNEQLANFIVRRHKDSAHGTKRLVSDIEVDKATLGQAQLLLNSLYGEDGLRAQLNDIERAVPSRLERRAESRAENQSEDASVAIKDFRALVSALIEDDLVDFRARATAIRKFLGPEIVESQLGKARAWEI
mgnify:CR=1 FL=1